MARVTMADVALEAGVNKGTVSRALRGDRRISAETRGRVWETAKKLGYELDAVASGLSSKRTGVAAVVLERMDAPWTGEFLSAAAGVLSRCKMELLLFEGGSASLAANVLRRIEGRKADGLIWFGAPAPELGALEIPVVCIGASSRAGQFSVALERESVSARIRALAGRRPVRYRGGPAAVMEFLSKLETETGVGEPFVIWDAPKNPPDGERPDLICGDERLARLLHVDCLRVPVRELGVLAARVMTNAIRGSGVRPAVTLVKTTLVSAAGELILG